MDPMKRVRLAVLFLIVAALCAGTTASAKDKLPAEEMVLLPVGDEPGASGKANLSSPWGGPVSVSCKGLTPGATYRIDHHAYYAGINPWGGWWSWWVYTTLFETTANGNGALKGKGTVQGNDYMPARAEYVYVHRVEASGDVLVLGGSRYNPW